MVREIKLDILQSEDLYSQTVSLPLKLFIVLQETKHTRFCNASCVRVSN